MSFTIGRYQVGFSVIDDLNQLATEFPFLNYSLVFQERMGIVRAVKCSYDGDSESAEHELELLRTKMVVMLGKVNEIFISNAKDYVNKARNHKEVSEK
jgi:hypothetical protein